MKRSDRIHYVTGELARHDDRQLITTALGAFTLAIWCILLLLPRTAFDSVSSSIVLFPLHLAGITPQGARLPQIWRMLGENHRAEGLVLQLTTAALVLLIIRQCRILAVIAAGSRTASLLSSALLSFMLLILLDFFTSTSRTYPFGGQTQYLLLVTFALVFAIRANAYWWRILMVTIIVCAVLQSAYTIWLYIMGVDVFTSPGIARATGTLEDLNPSYLYPLCLMGALLLMPLASSEKRLPLRLVYWLSIALLIGALLLTFTRAAAMGLALGLIWLACEERRNKQFWILGALALIVMVSVFMVRATGKSGHLGVDRAALGRVQIWRISTKIIQNNWLLGVGYGEYENAQKRYMDPKLASFNPMNTEAKNQALTMMASHGVLGAGVYLLFIYATWAACRNGKKENYTPWECRLKQGVKLAGIGILTAGLMDTPLYTYDRCPGTFVWLVCMGFLLHLEMRNHPPSSEWKLAKALRTAALSAVALAVLGAGSVITLGVVDARHASKTFDAKIDAVRAKPSFVSMGHVPKAMDDCVIANEDYFFYEPHGYSLVDMHRALRVDIRAGRVKQGGSTITQQLAKNLFFSKDRTPRRKVAELIMAVRLEHRLTKPEILEAYLNTIDFGLCAKGIGPAAKRFFGTDASRLTDAECALLAGLISSPPKEKLTPDRARAALALTLDRLHNVNLSRCASVQDEVENAGVEHWLRMHLLHRSRDCPQQKKATTFLRRKESQ